MFAAFTITHNTTMNANVVEIVVHVVFTDVLHCFDLPIFHFGPYDLDVNCLFVCLFRQYASPLRKSNQSNRFSKKNM